MDMPDIPAPRPPPMRRPPAPPKSPSPAAEITARIRHPSHRPVGYWQTQPETHGAIQLEGRVPPVMQRHACLVNKPALVETQLRLYRVTGSGCDPPALVVR
jgi:hypothetical protein